MVLMNTDNTPTDQYARPPLPEPASLAMARPAATSDRLSQARFQGGARRPVPQAAGIRASTMPAYQLEPKGIAASSKL